VEEKRLDPWRLEAYHDLAREIGFHIDLDYGSVGVPMDGELHSCPDWHKPGRASSLAQRLFAHTHLETDTDIDNSIHAYTHTHIRAHSHDSTYT
jgi:hypothetical protein